MDTGTGKTCTPTKTCGLQNTSPPSTGRAKEAGLKCSGTDSRPLHSTKWRASKILTERLRECITAATP